MKKRFLQWLIDKLTSLYDKLYYTVNDKDKLLNKCLNTIEHTDHNDPNSYEELLNCYRVLIEEFSGSRDKIKLEYFYIYLYTYKHLVRKYVQSLKIPLTIDEIFLQKKLINDLVIKPLPPLMEWNDILHQHVEYVPRPGVPDENELEKDKIESYDLNQARINPTLLAKVLEKYPDSKITPIRFDPPIRILIDIDRGELVEKFNETYFNEEQIGKVFEVLDSVRK